MFLYELTSPVELKYGGELTTDQSARCSRVTELNSPRWSPFPARRPHVENLCGKFVIRVDGSTATAPGETPASGDVGSDARADDLRYPSYISCLSNQQEVVDPRLSSVCFRINSPFGKQWEMFHMDGHVTIRCTPGLPRSMIFKGSKGVQGVVRLMRDLFLDDGETMPLAHMGVVSSCMGLRLQTSQCCYLENRIIEGFGPMRGGWITVETRAPDQCNVVRLSVKDWSVLLPGHLLHIAPTANDLVITGRGSVVHRLSWAGLPWDEEVERELLEGCGRVVDAVAAVC